MTENMDKKEIQELYAMLRQKSFDEWTQSQPPANLLFAARLAHKLNEEDFCTAIATGEVDAIELSEDEMAMIRGGEFGGIGIVRWGMRKFKEAWDGAKAGGNSGGKKRSRR